MANFPPFRNYLFYCLDQAITQYGLQAPFLDAGCGQGYFSLHLAERGWSGKAIDLSKFAIKAARSRLAGQPQVQVEQKKIEEEKGRYQSIFLLDILEHLPDDRGALKSLTRRLEAGGHLVLAVPSNPQEWGWDDDFYGHVRRYTLPDLEKKFAELNFEIIAAWDFTFPVFYGLRRMQLKFGKRPDPHQQDLSAVERTEHSGLSPEWQESWPAKLLTGLAFAWWPFCILMFRFFRLNVRRGHEMIVIARPIS